MELGGALIELTRILTVPKGGLGSGSC